MKTALKKLLILINIQCLASMQAHAMDFDPRFSLRMPEEGSKEWQAMKDALSGKKTVHDAAPAPTNNSVTVSVTNSVRVTTSHQGSVVTNQVDVTPIEKGVEEEKAEHLAYFLTFNKGNI